MILKTVPAIRRRVCSLDGWRSSELQLGARGRRELVAQHVPHHRLGDVVGTEGVQMSGGHVVVRVSHAVLKKHERGQRDEQHGGQRRAVGHRPRGHVPCSRVGTTAEPGVGLRWRGRGGRTGQSLDGRDGSGSGL